MRTERTVIVRKSDVERSKKISVLRSSEPKRVVSKIFYLRLYEKNFHFDTSIGMEAHFSIAFQFIVDIFIIIHATANRRSEFKKIKQ